jgi:hypothetical protein
VIAITRILRGSSKKTEPPSLRFSQPPEMWREIQQLQSRIRTRSFHAHTPGKNLTAEISVG